MRFAILAATLVLALAAALTFGPRAPGEGAATSARQAEIRAYLLDNPEILREMVARLEEREAAGQDAADADLVARNAGALFDDGFSHVGGNPEGSFTLVEFIDYQCGFCRRAHPEVGALVSGDGDIRLITKEMPILGPGSELAARAALATLIAEGPEAYLRLRDMLMAVEGPVTDVSLDAALLEADLDPALVRPGMDDAEVTRRLAETRELAQAMGISGTPTFVFGDRMVRGYLPLDDMRSLVASLRDDDTAPQ